MTDDGSNAALLHVCGTLLLGYATAAMTVNSVALTLDEPDGDPPAPRPYPESR